MSQHQNPAIAAGTRDATRNMGTQPQEPHMHQVVFAVGNSGNIYNTGDEPPWRLAGTHAKQNQWGPFWGSKVPIGAPFRSLLDITEDDLGPNKEPTHANDVSNTVWVIFMDQRIAYIPRWKAFRVLTLPIGNGNLDNYYACGVIAPQWSGTWIVFLHGMYWLPPETDDTHIAYIMTKSREMPVHLDHKGQVCLPFDPKSGEKFPDCLMLFSPRANEMYLESGYYKKGAIRIPDARFIVMIRGSVQPLNSPPFRQWNLLRAERWILDDAQAMNKHSKLNNPYKAILTNGVAKLASAIGRATPG
ncbi:hypothetical protein F5Y06DRAFT_255499 [Hypoxylon sp. FL0890]|nr:hypothetical protein F5Y06DRAFT_255499 [Hypoxylon sp. FL0890]